VTDTPLPDIDGQHRLDTGTPATSEPVRLAGLLTTALYAAAGAGWFVIPDKTIDLIGTIVAVVLSVVGTELARARVSPSGRITVASIRGVIRAEVYAEVNRLADAPLPTLLSGDVRKG
jgi:hypothetical protein